MSLITIIFCNIFNYFIRWFKYQFNTIIKNIIEDNIVIKDIIQIIRHSRTSSNILKNIHTNKFQGDPRYHI